MEGIRQRISKAEDALQTAKVAYKNAASEQQETSDRAFNFNPVQDRVSPVFVTLASFAEKIRPIVNKVSKVASATWEFLRPYHPEDLFVAFCGFFLVFFGGIYMTIVAAAEAAHLFGWDRIKVAFSALYAESINTKRAFERDNRLDTNWDGVADVNQLDAKNLAGRRMMVLVKSINPQNVSLALEGLTMATVAILATLRVRFARAITLGTAIGEVLNKIFHPFTTQMLKFSLSDDFEKWIPVINKYGFRYLGMTASWILMRAVTSVFSALRGSSLFITGVSGYLVRHNYVGSNVFTEGNPLFVAAWALLALLGMYWQFSSSFRLPFPINLLLLPVTAAEQFLIFAVGVSAK